MTLRDRYVRRVAGHLDPAERVLREIFNTDTDGRWYRFLHWYCDWETGRYGEVAERPLWIRIVSRPIWYLEDWRFALALRHPTKAHR
jgi:hypothetical protein